MPTITAEPRAFMVGRPVMRISNATTHAVLRIINWDIDANDFNLTDYSWQPHEQAPWDEAEDGVIYTQVDGARMHCGLTFEYWHPDYIPLEVAQQGTFTEWDYRWILESMQGITYDIEFFPFDTIPMGTTPPNLDFLCRVRNLTRTRSGGNAWKWDCSLEVYGKQVRTSIPTY